MVWLASNSYTTSMTSSFPSHASIETFRIESQSAEKRNRADRKTQISKGWTFWRYQ